MAISHFNWIVDMLARNASNDGVYLVHWSCFGFDGGWQDHISGVAELTPNPSDPNFIPFEDLTEDQVFEWVYASGVDKDSVEQEVTNRIAEKINPTTLYGKPSAWFPQQPDRD